MSDARKYARKTGKAPPAEHQFKPGNPGKPKGARHRVSLAVEALLAGEAEALTRKAIESALAGDSTALRLCLERIAPAPKERPIKFRVPAIACAEDVPSALSAVLGAVASGDITPGEGAAVATLVDRFRSAFELTELERRIAQLEAAK
jgi:hypothetical protein